MPPRRIVALGLRGALAYCCAVLVHGVVHALGSRTFQPDSAAHIVMTLIAVALLAAIAVPLGLGSAPPERRRRLALVRAALGPPSLARFATDLVVQGVLALLLLVAEGASLAPDRLVIALAWGLLALLLSTSLLTKGGEHVIALLVALVAPARTRKTASRAAQRASYRRICEPYQLFVPNRPPPVAV